MGIRFRVRACPIDASTGDRRRFAKDSLSYQQLPMPMAWVRQAAEGHDGAVTVGFIDGVEIEPEDVWLEGEIFTASDEGITPSILEDAASALFLARKGVVGPSVDLDDFDAAPVRLGSDKPLTTEDFDDPEMEMEYLVTKGRMRGATLVHIPAFVETNHSMTFVDEDDEAVSEPDNADADEDDGDYALTATVAGATDLPVADRDHAWDGPAAAKRVLDSCADDDGKIDKACASRAFLWVDGDGTERGDYKLGYADLINGELTIIPRGVAATAGGRGVRSTKGVDEKAVESKICTLYGKIRSKYDDWPECPFDSSSSAAAVTAAVGEKVYPLSVFEPPLEIAGPTPITYDWDAGVVYGHVAGWKTCHQGFPDSCVLAPRAPGGSYREFHTHRVETEEGTIYTGRLTAGGQHPSSRDASIHAHQVRQHHDTMITVANVLAKEDEWGIFVCGPLSPELDEGTQRLLSRRKVSPDWRETVDGLSMIEVLALKDGPRETAEPGFPIQMSFHGARLIALTAELGPAVPAVTAGAVMTAELFRETANRLVLEALDKAQAAGFARAELEATMGADIARRRDELAKMIGV